MASGRDSVVPVTRIRVSRETVLLLGGLIIVWHETLVSTEARWNVLVFCGWMMGMTVPLRADRKREEGH